MAYATIETADQINRPQYRVLQFSESFDSSKCKQQKSRYLTVAL